jgi:ABC-2 type transport system permease protein
MRAWAVFKKELRLYFSSPIAYAVLTIFALVAGWFFYNVFAYYTIVSMQAAMNPMMARDLSVADGVLRPLFSNISVIMLLMMPILTMRLFSEEKKSGTIELLLTYPVRDGEVLLGKYLAALTVFVAMLGLTLAYPLIVAWVTPQVEWGPLATGYLGLLLQGAAFIAIGILISSLTENQIVAAVATFGTLLIFWVISWASDSAGGNLGRVLSHLSLTEHFDSFAKGVIDTKDLIYYLNLTILALFLTLRSLESKRWRG